MKTKKTAGTSVEVFLSKFCGENDVLTPIYPPVESHICRNFEDQGFYNHMPAKEIMKLVPEEVWRSYYKFCIERNPWDKTLSHYYMLKSRSQSFRGLSLDQYLKKGEYCINYPLYLDDHGELLVDDVLYYEDIVFGLNAVFERLGIPFDGDLGVRAKSEYRSDMRHYTEVLSANQRKKIAKVFSNEILLHSYEY